MVESNASHSKVAKKSHKESILFAGKVSKGTVKLHVTRQFKKPPTQCKKVEAADK